MTIDNVGYYARGDDAVAQIHIGMFLAWALERGHATTEWAEDLLPIVEARRGKPSELIASCDGKLVEEQLTPPALAFAEQYYPDTYFEDFHDQVIAKAGFFTPADSWKAFDRLAAVLDQRFAAFRA